MTDANATGEKTYTVKDIEIERAHAQAAREEARELRERYKDIDPEDYRRIKEEHSKLKTKDAGGDEKKIAEIVAEQIASEKKRLEGAYNEEKSKRETTERELKKERVVKVILQKASAAFDKDALELLEPVFERDGDFIDGHVVIKGADGKPRYSPKDATKLMTPDEYVEELQSKYPSAAKATAAAGTKSGVTKVNGASGQALTMAEISKLPDKGRAYFNELARTPEGQKQLEQYLK